MKKLFILSALLFLMSPMAKAETRMFKLELWAQNFHQRSLLSNIVHLDVAAGEKAYAVVNEYDYRLLKLKLPHLIHSVSSFSYEENQLANVWDFPPGDSDYHNYDEVKDKLDELAADYPELVSRLSLGESVQGKELPMIRISSSNDRLPTLFIVGTHHAREHLSTEVPLGLAEFLVKSYGADERITKLLDENVVFVAPLLNPDGSQWDIYGQQYKAWRKNRAEIGGQTLGVDLNRNYSHGWGGEGSSSAPGSDIYRGEKPFSEPETSALKKFVEEHSEISILLSFHTYSELILYPWGHKTGGIGGEDEQVFTTMAQKMAEWNGYRPMQASGLYVASGDTCDWAWGERGIFCFTFELTPRYSWGPYGFYPGPGAIAPTIEKNKEPVLYLLENAAAPRSVLSN